MNSLLSGTTIVSGVTALLLFVVFIYLYRLSRERDRRRLQAALLAFSALERELGSRLQPQELVPSLEKMLDTLISLARAEGVAILIVDAWRNLLPLAQRGFAADFLARLDDLQAAGRLRSRLQELDPGGRLRLTAAALSGGEGSTQPALRDFLEARGALPATLFRLGARDRLLGCMLLSTPGRGFGAWQLNLLQSLSLQVSTTLEKYILLQEAQRHIREYERLTQIGQVVSARLNADEVLQAIHKELGQLFDTDTFYVALLRDEEVHFEFEIEEGVLQPRRTRPATNGLTEHVIRAGQPLLIRSDMEAARARLGVRPLGRPAKCFCGAPIVIQGRAAGMMAALHYQREFVYDEQDLEVLTTAAGQLAVAMENARLFAQEQQRARYLEFLNVISKTAISSQDAEQMLAEIVGEIQKNFRFDHIGIGILDYATKDIEIKAEAGTTARALGRRIPLGVGILGRVARSSEMALVQNLGEGRLLGILPESRSVLCLPVTYGETLLGVLNVESRRESAFAQQEVLILRTLADLLATALHNAFVFQKMQQQSITDGLTGIKTRRYLMEALLSEWKRASRSGRPFSLVLIDLDKFKEVNDAMGHLEGDLVLARVGRLLEQKCRQSNVVARYGGDEFVILMPETGVEQAQILSERLRLWIATDPMLNDRHITGSFGVATFPLHGSAVEDIIRVADAGMYVSKHGGGNRVSTAEQFAEDEAAAQHRHTIAAYVEGFLRREHTGPGSAEELIGTLKKLSAAIKDGSNVQALMDAIRAITRAVETRELHSAGHGESVGHYVQIIGQELSLSADEMGELVYAARVHDVGKIIIPERLLNKAGPLTPDEYGLMKSHAAIGGEIMEAIPGSNRLREIVRHHHERFDGTGYPDGLKGERIPLGARIISVAESYANMISERPYAPITTSAEAMAELEALTGTQYDGMLVRIFVRSLRGEKVARSSGN